MVFTNLHPNKPRDSRCDERFYTESKFHSVLSADVLNSRVWATVNFQNRGHRGPDRMVVGFTTTCAIRAYHHQSCKLKSRSCRGVLVIADVMKDFILRANFIRCCLLTF
jgi:hypothetical protein